MQNKILATASAASSTISEEEDYGSNDSDNIDASTVTPASNQPEDTERMDWTDISRFRLQYDF